jgi:hypothetical protein
MTRTQLPEWSRTRLESQALGAVYLDLAHERSVRESANVDRLVVNMLRHEFSDYDADQSQDAHEFVCRTIGTKYVWLSEECERQIESRVRNERVGAEFLESCRAWEAAVKEPRPTISSLFGGHWLFQGR